MAAGALALIAVIAVVGTLALRRAPAVASYRVPAAKVALVKIDFGEELAQRSFRWKGKLERGSNPIPIAVKGPRKGRYRVITHAVGADLDVTHELWLDVTT